LIGVGDLEVIGGRPSASWAFIEAINLSLDRSFEIIYLIYNVRLSAKHGLN
jgi:hypothetical protein